MSNFIYVFDVNADYSVISSTKYPKDRLEEYSRNYVPINNKPIQFRKLYKIDRICYPVEYKLKKDSNRGFIRIAETEEFSNASQKIYKLDNSASLEKWFIKNNIEFEEYDVRLCNSNIKEHAREYTVEYRTS